MISKVTADKIRYGFLILWTIYLLVNAIKWMVS